MAWFNIYPTCDIHLVRTNGLPIDVEVIDWGGSNLVSSPDTTWDDFDPAIVSISKFGDTIRFQPVADGVSIGRIKNTTTEHYELLVRVTVHKRIEKFWIGNSNATIHEGESNYVLSVFAKFNDNTIGDVSSHSFIDFRVPTPGGFLSINNSDDKGRLTGISDSANVPITVEVSHTGLPPQTIDVKVREPLTQTRNLLELVQLSGLYTEKKNILIISEGFESSDRTLFNEAVLKMTQALFDTNQQTPYDILKDSFNVWKAFIPSTESGITILSPLATDGRPIPSSLPNSISNRLCSSMYSGRQLVKMVGLPGNSPPANLAAAITTWSAQFGALGFDPSKVDQPLFDDWLTQGVIGFAQAKDSFFGLGMGGRYGDRYPRNTPEPLNSYYLSSVPARAIAPDVRRLKRNGVRERHYFYLQFLSSLRLLSGSTTDVNREVYKSWVDTTGAFSRGKDYPLVCFIAKDNYRCGTNWGPLSITLGSNRQHPIQINASKIAHLPTVTLQIGDMDRINIPAKTSTLAHEFGHSLKLLDEYEGYDDPSHTSFPNTQSEKDRFKERGWNLTHFFDIQRPNPNPHDLIDATKIPWNWHRVTKASLSVKPAFNQGSSQIVIRMKPGEGANWQNERNNNVEIFLRHPELNRDVNDRTNRIEGPLTIDRITPNSTTGDVFILNGRTRDLTGSNPYPEGSILFVPLRDRGNNILTTIDPAVVAYINDLTSGMGEGKPFMKKANCDSCDNATGYPPNNIAGLSYPTNRCEVIGLYEGAGTYNCKVYRPAGICKMRQSHEFKDNLGKARMSSFSFIAKYIIVSVIDPTKLPLINIQYP